MADGETHPLLSSDLVAALQRLDTQAELRSDPERLWAVRDVPLDVRATAEWQARQKGEPLGAWLTDAILSYARPAPAIQAPPEIEFFWPEPAALQDEAEPDTAEAVFELRPPQDPQVLVIEPLPAAATEAAMLAAATAELALEIEPEGEAGLSPFADLEILDAFLPSPEACPVEPAPAEPWLVEAEAEADAAPVLLEAIELTDTQSPSVPWPREEPGKAKSYADLPAFQPVNTLHGGSDMDLICETVRGLIAYAAVPERANETPPLNTDMVGASSLGEPLDDDERLDQPSQEVELLAAWTPPEAEMSADQWQEDDIAATAEFDPPPAQVPGRRRSWLASLLRGRKAA